MASETGLRHDDLLFLLFATAYHFSGEDSLTTQGEPGRLLQQGFVWTTKYSTSHEHFFAIRGNRTPDGHLLFETGSVLVTIEATTNPSKSSLIPQIAFFSSQEYATTVVDQDHHEIWIFASAGAIDGVSKQVGDLLKNDTRELKVPVVLWSVDYDRQRHRYTIEKVSGQHSPGIPSGRRVPPERIEVGRPQSFPLLSSKLSFPAVCYAVGRELLKEILNPGLPRTIKQYHAAFAANAVPLSYFAKAIGYLQQIVPELVEISKGSTSVRTLRVKRNIAEIDGIQRKLDEIRRCEDENDIVNLVKKYRASEPAQTTKEERPRPPEEATLDRFMEG